MLFDEFRQIVKKLAKQQGYTYAKMASMIGVEENTIKGFMCGASDSRRIAEKIADLLKLKLIYSNGEYSIMDSESEE